MAHVAAVEQHGVAPAAWSRCSTMLAMVDLPAPDRPVNHTIAGRCCLSATRSALAIQRLPIDVGSAPQSKGNHAGAHRVVGAAVWGGLMRILLTGTEGQVGGALLPLLQGHAEIIAPSMVEFNFTDLDSLEGKLDGFAPDLIIVDRAEESELAFLVNAKAPAVLGRWAARHGVPLLHFSTDYVFDGSGQAPVAGGRSLSAAFGLWQEQTRWRNQHPRGGRPAFDRPHLVGVCVQGRQFHAHHDPACPRAERTARRVRSDRRAHLGPLDRGGGVDQKWFGDQPSATLYAHQAQLVDRI